MKYDKAALRATALSVKDEWVTQYKRVHAAEARRYSERFGVWEAKHKASDVAFLTSALKNVKAGKPLDVWTLRDAVKGAPPEPSALECCTPVTKTLDGLIELLDQVKDDEVSSSALADAGFRDLRNVLRRPC